MRPQLDFPREKIQNREAILNFFEFVALEAGHPYHPMGAPGRLGRAWEGLKREFENFWLQIESGSLEPQQIDPLESNEQHLRAWEGQ